MSSILLNDDGPSWAWIRWQLAALAKVRVNNLLHRVRGGAAKGRPRSFEDYERLFVTLRKPSGLRRIRLDDDAVFAWLRVAGLNPMLLEHIERVPDHFPVTDAHLRAVPGFEHDDLAAAGHESRLFLVDYRDLTPRGGEAAAAGKYAHAPLALFALPTDRRALQPIAIQTAQVPSADAPLATPRDGEYWRIARTAVEVADVGHHQPLSHGLAHLFSEAFAVATRRQLSERHPVRALLEPHFEGTMYINSMASWGLLQVGTLVDDIMAGPIPLILRLAGENVRRRSFRETMPPRAIAARGVADSSLLPNYPYRDDALRVWDAIQCWVRDYLRLYYNTDAEVVLDTEVQAWIADVTSPDGGRLRDVADDERVLSLRALTDVVAHVIFTASAQHSALNTPQYELMSYAPLAPMAAYRPAVPGGASSWLDVLPPLERAQQQMELGYRLGSGQLGVLGRYARGTFCDPRVAEPLREFQNALRLVEDAIQERNRTAAFPYEFLLPSRISPSVNI